MMEEAVLEST